MIKVVRIVRFVRVVRVVRSLNIPTTTLKMEGRGGWFDRRDVIGVLAAF